MIVVATVFVAIGIAIIGGWWIAADERGGARHPATTMTAQEAAKVAAHVVRELEAQRVAVPPSAGTPRPLVLFCFP